MIKFCIVIKHLIQVPSAGITIGLSCHQISHIVESVKGIIGLIPVLIISDKGSDLYRLDLITHCCITVDDIYLACDSILIVDLGMQSIKLRTYSVYEHIILYLVKCRIYLIRHFLIKFIKSRLCFASKLLQILI